MKSIFTISLSIISMFILLSDAQLSATAKPTASQCRIQKKQAIEKCTEHYIKKCDNENLAAGEKCREKGGSEQLTCMRKRASTYTTCKKQIEACKKRYNAAYLDCFRGKTHDFDIPLNQD